ncbi:hypothetical protein [Phenylobacterium sp.]|uniref:hypothetical protein n=1 Tax=Phenylobacterium sp. TaxID=1871053 RepID=UPI0035AF3A47
MTSLLHARDGALWSAGLLVTVVGGCLALACLEPLVAVAVLAAGALPIGRALLVTAAVWLAGQAVGFGLHDYPVDRMTIGWGIGLGVAAMVSTVAAAAALAHLRGRPAWFRAGIAFVAAFVVDQLALLGVQQVVQGSCEIVPGVITQVGLINAAWLAALLALDQAAVHASGGRAGFGRRTAAA